MCDEVCDLLDTLSAVIKLEDGGFSIDLNSSRAATRTISEELSSDVIPPGEADDNDNDYDYDNDNEGSKGADDTSRSKGKKVALILFASLLLLALVIGLSVDNIVSRNGQSQKSSANTAVTLEDCLKEEEEEGLKQSMLTSTDAPARNPTTFPTYAPVEVGGSRSEESGEATTPSTSVRSSNDFGANRSLVRRDLRGDIQSSPANEAEDENVVLQKLRCEELLANQISSYSFSSENGKNKNDLSKSGQSKSSKSSTTSSLTSELTPTQTKSSKLPNSKSSKTSDSKGSKSSKTSSPTNGLTPEPTQSPIPLPSLSITPQDPTIIDGGEPGRSYFLDLLAENIPPNVSEVRFEWAGLGTTDSAVASVVNGIAETTFDLSSLQPGPFEISAFVFAAGSQDELASDSLSARIAGPAMVVTPSPGLTNGSINTEYTFTLNVTDLPSGVDNVIFLYAFNFPIDVAFVDSSVVNGQATTTVSNSFPTDGSFGFVWGVRDADDPLGLVLGGSSVIVIGMESTRSFTLDSCGDFVQSNSTGMDTAVLDTWDISAIPTDVTFDIRGDFTGTVSSLFNVDYPDGQNRVLEAEPSGPFTANNIFTRLIQSDQLQVSTISLMGGWSYEIQCVEISTMEESYSQSLVQEVLREAFGLPPRKKKEEEAI